MSKEILRTNNGTFRLYPISKLQIAKGNTEPSFVTYEPKDGIGVDMSCGDGAYIVLAFVKPDHDGDVTIEPTIHFWNNVNEDNYAIVRKLINLAKDIIITLNYVDAD